MAAIMVSYFEHTNQASRYILPLAVCLLFLILVELEILAMSISQYNTTFHYKCANKHVNGNNYLGMSLGGRTKIE